MSLKVRPFITLCQRTQSLRVHSLEHSGGLCAFVNVIEVKQKDYSAFTDIEFCGDDSQNDTHIGVFVSDVAQQIEGKSVRFLFLQNSEHYRTKISDKFTDLFAGIMMSLSDVCVFDLNSKFLRNFHFDADTSYRQTFVVMNTSEGQLYSVKMHNKSNKMEI